jgi:hypothetical protein
MRAQLDSTPGAECSLQGYIMFCRFLCIYQHFREACYSLLCGRLIELFLNKTCSKGHVGKHLCDTCPIENDLKQRDAFSPLRTRLLSLLCGMGNFGKI